MLPSYKIKRIARNAVNRVIKDEDYDSKRLADIIENGTIQVNAIRRAYEGIDVSISALKQFAQNRKYAGLITSVADILLRENLITKDEHNGAMLLSEYLLTYFSEIQIEQIHDALRRVSDLI